MADAPPPLTPNAPPAPERVYPPPISSPQVAASCPNCRTAIPVDPTRRDQEVRCPFCRKTITFQIFPRLTRTPPPEPISEVAAPGEATCRFYPELKAEVVCDACGCFLSRRASIRWADRPLCMPCLHALREEKADTEFRADLKIWDNRALALLALAPFTLFTAPVAIFLLVRFRREPRGWVPRSSLRWWLAMILALLTLGAWIALIVIWIALVVREIT